MTTDRQPSAAAKAWARENVGGSYEDGAMESYARHSAARGFDAGAGAERERVCIWSHSGKYLVNPHHHYMQDDPRDEGDLFCSYCGGKIVVKEEQ